MCMPTVVSVTLARLGPGEPLRVFISQDEPAYKIAGAKLQMDPDEARSLLLRLGVDVERATRILERLAAPHTRHEVRLALSEEQERYLRLEYPGW
jgi:hypothetical protein